LDIDGRVPGRSPAHLDLAVRALVFEGGRLAAISGANNAVIEADDRSEWPKPASSA
jgi:hypothetical protein